MEISEETIAKDEYDIIMIGGGPATLAFFTYLTSNNLLDHFMQLDILIIERGTNFGSGKLAKYGIFSNTPASDFFSFLFKKLDEKHSFLQHFSDSSKNLSYHSSIFESLSKCNITKCLKNYGHQKAPLPLIGLFLECVGNTILAYINEKFKKKIFAYKTEVTEIEILNRNNVIKSRNYNIKENNYEVTTYKNNEFRKIKSKVLILSNGNKLKVSKRLLDKYKSFNSDNVYHSDYFLQEEGYNSITRLIRLKEGTCQISLIGGSHSAFSSAWLLLNSPSIYKLSKHNPYMIKFDKNCKICLNMPKCLCYGEVKDKNWNCEYSSINYLEENTTPKVEIKIMYRDHNKTFLYYNSEKVDLLGKEKWVKMIQCENFKEQKKHLHDADIILCAFGYGSQPIPFYEIGSDGVRNKVKFAFDKKNKEFRIDSNLRLMDWNQNSFLSLFGLGHGYTTLPRLNFKGNNNNHIRYSFYYFHSYISKKLYLEIFDLFAAKIIRFKIINFEEYNSLKNVKKSDLNVRKIIVNKKYNSNANKNIIRSKLKTNHEENEKKDRLILPDINFNHRHNRFITNPSSDNLKTRSITITTKREINKKSESKLKMKINKSESNNNNNSRTKSKGKKKSIKLKLKIPKKKIKDYTKLNNIKEKELRKLNPSYNKTPVWFQPCTNKIYRFNYESCVWTYVEDKIKSDIIFPFNYSIADLKEGSLIVTGGELKNKSIQETFLYEDGIITKLPNMIYPRKNHSTIYSLNFCFVFGGYNDDSILDTCEKFDINNHKWYLINTMRFPRANSCLLVKNNNFIYIFGGIGNVDCPELFFMNQIELYDISLDIFNILNINIPFLINSSFVYYHNEESLLITGGKLKDKINCESVILNVIDASIKNSDLKVEGWSKMFPVYNYKGALHFFYFNCDTLEFPLYQKYFVETALY